MNLRRWTIPSACAFLLLLASSPRLAAAEGSQKADPPGGSGKRGMSHKQRNAEFDADADGVLSESEKATLRESVKQRLHKPLQERMIKKFDENGDGVLSDAEKKKAHDHVRARLLKRFDKDGDGQLSEAEHEEMRKANVPLPPFPEMGEDAADVEIDPQVETLPLPQPPSAEK
jgi:Ca2+-binding EF-hand superfamily protein